MSQRGVSIANVLNQPGVEHSGPPRLVHLDEIYGKGYVAQQEAMRQQMELAFAQFELQKEANKNQQAYLANLRESQAPTEQEKQALDAGQRSRSATEAEQIRRRGLMSLFTRYMSQPESTGATGSKATILGV